MRATSRHHLIGLGSAAAALIAGALALILAAIVTALISRYSDAGAAQSDCMVGSAPSDAATDESAHVAGELSGWPLGLRCIYPTADGGTTTVGPDFSLTLVAIASVALAMGCGASWIFSRERRRQANHHRVVEQRRM